MEHTQGKWYIGSIGRNAGRRITIRSHKDPLKGQCVGTVHSQSENAEANARLIAAAPDLLALLQDILEWDGILPHCQTRIKQAIAQAQS